jgi:hypothetical protein
MICEGRLSTLDKMRRTIRGHISTSDK